MVESLICFPGKNLGPASISLKIPEVKSGLSLLVGLQKYSSPVFLL